jgi:hypothetical protein
VFRKREEKGKDGESWSGVWLTVKENEDWGSSDRRRDKPDGSDGVVGDTAC